MSTASTRKELSHDRILDAASRAIRRAGCDGVGVADIMKEAGLTHGGFYAHFPSRDALLVEALDRAGRDSGAVLAGRIREREARGHSPFSALVHTYLHDSHLADTEHGCPVAALGSEMPRQSEAVADAARRRVLSLTDTVRRHLPEDTDPAQAPAVTATLVGALQLARALGGKAGKAWLASARDGLMRQFEPGARG